MTESVGARALVSHDPDTDRARPAVRAGVRLKTLFSVGTLVGAFTYLYGPVLAGMISEWIDLPEYSHGSLIPLIAVYLLWSRRDALRRLRVQPSLAGMWVLAVGLALALAGSAAAEQFLTRVSLVITLLGLTYVVAGWAAIRLAVFPVGYLVLMIPIPHVVFKQVSLALRYFDAQVAAELVRVFGIPVFREGFLLHLPTISLEVADGCSGVFSIMALLAVGIVYVEQTQRGLAPRIIMWATLVPVAIAANIVRIVLIAVLVDRLGPWVLSAPVHEFSGLVNFLVGFVVVVALGQGLRRVTGSRRSREIG